MVLQACSRLISRARLERELEIAGWQLEEPSYLEEVIADLTARGLLRRGGELRAGLERTPASRRAQEPPPRLTQAWISAGRPNTVARSVESFLKRGVGAAEGLRVYIDRCPPEAVGAATSKVSAVAEQCGEEVSVLALPERQRFANALCEELGARMNRRLVDFALNAFDEPTSGAVPIGAMRNWFLLSSPGQIAISTDDDVIAQFLRHPSAEGRPKLTGAPGVLRERYFANRSELLEYAVAYNGGAHSHFDAVADAELLRKADLEDLGAVDGARVSGFRPAVSAAGIAGDSGMFRPQSRLLLLGENRDDLVANQSDFEELLLTRSVLRHAPELTFSTSPELMTPYAGFDTRLPLVPFFPVGRGEDSLFRQVLAIVQPELLQVHLPFGVRHEPEEERVLEPQAYSEVAPRSFGLFSCVFQAISAETSLQAGYLPLALRLSAIASERPSAFRRQVEQMWIAWMTGYVRSADAMLEYFDFEPKHWSRVLEAHVNAVVDFLAGGQIFPVDYTEHGPEQAWEALRENLTLYAELLAEWPALWEAASKLEGVGGV
jgi:hypothetical protein